METLTSWDPGRCQRVGGNIPFISNLNFHSVENSFHENQISFLLVIFTR